MESCLAGTGAMTKDEELLYAKMLEQLKKGTSFAFSAAELEKLRGIAKQITILPREIHIPIQYLLKQD